MSPADRIADLVVATPPATLPHVGPLAGTGWKRTRTRTRSLRTRPSPPPPPPPRTRRSSNSAAGWQRTAASTPRLWPSTPRHSWARVSTSRATWPTWTTATGPHRSRRCTSRRSRWPWPRATSTSPSRRARWIKMTRSAPRARDMHWPTCPRGRVHVVPLPHRCLMASRPSLMMPSRLTRPSLTRSRPSLTRSRPSPMMPSVDPSQFKSMNARQLLS